MSVSRPEENKQKRVQNPKIPETFGVVTPKTGQDGPPPDDNVEGRVKKRKTSTSSENVSNCPEGLNVAPGRK